MVGEMSEMQARRVLSKAGSPAADPASYRARRISGGWSFGWREDAGPPLIGAIGWVVADNGRCRGQRLGMRADQVVQALMDADSPD